MDTSSTSGSGSTGFNFNGNWPSGNGNGNYGGVGEVDGVSPYIFLRLMYPEHSIEYRFLDANEINGFLEENLANNYFKNCLSQHL